MCSYRFNAAEWALSLTDIPGNQLQYLDMEREAETAFDAQRGMLMALMKASFFELSLEPFPTLVDSDEPNNVPNKEPKFIAAGKRIRRAVNAATTKYYVRRPVFLRDTDETEDVMDVLSMCVLPHSNVQMTKLRVKYWNNAVDDYRIVGVRVNGRNIC